MNIKYFEMIAVIVTQEVTIIYIYIFGIFLPATETHLFKLPVEYILYPSSGLHEPTCRRVVQSMLSYQNHLPKPVFSNMFFTILHKNKKIKYFLRMCDIFIFHLPFGNLSTRAHMYTYTYVNLQV